MQMQMPEQPTALVQIKIQQIFSILLTLPSQERLRQQEGLGARVKEIAIAYEKALTTHLRDLGRTPVEQLRLQYEAVLATLRDVQFQIAEAIADSWALVTQQGIAIKAV